MSDIDRGTLQEKTHTTTESIYGPAEEAPVEVGMSAEVLASLNSLEQLEERVSSILIDESAKVRGFLFHGEVCI